MNERLMQLQRIYRLFDGFIQPHPLACEKGCAACCTRNVVMTALEGEWILQNLDASATGGLFDRIIGLKNLPRFQPTLTLNQMADLLDSGEDVPDEEGNPDWDICPLLEEGKCTIYAFRPFMCRSMVSEISCRDLGHATMNPFVLTVAHVLMQYVEHLDVKGFSGNLSDVFLELAESDGVYRADLTQPSAVRRVVIPNRPLRRLMVPWEHREKIQDLIKKLDSKV